MAITITGSPMPQRPIPKKKKCGHTQPQCPRFSLDEPGHKVIGGKDTTDNQAEPVTGGNELRYL